MDTAVPAVMVASLIWMFVDFLRAVTNRQWPSVVTHLVSWGAGVAAIEIFAHTGWADGVVIGSRTLNSFNGFDLLVAGLLVTSLVKPALSVTRAVDATDSNKQPPLVP